jgi:hypothetical protein
MIERAEKHLVATFQVKVLKALIVNKNELQTIRYQLHSAFTHYTKHLLSASLKALVKYHQHKSKKSRQLKLALAAHHQHRNQQVLVQCLKVGVYWKQIKGRFNPHGARRSYLAMKYGMRWLGRVKLKYNFLTIYQVRARLRS